LVDNFFFDNHDFTKRRERITPFQRQAKAGSKKDERGFSKPRSYG
jgi:hypothetical protein